MSQVAQLPSFPKFQTLTGQWHGQHIFNLQLNRPTKMNALSIQFFKEMYDCVVFLNQCPELRCVVFTGNGKAFSSGLDLKDAPELFNLGEDLDQARKSIRLYNLIRDMQKATNAFSDCRVPVIVGVHGLCIGGGIDLIGSADVRYCTADAKFTIKEVDIGICADIGTTQRIPLICGNDSLFRELSYTGRFFDASEALRLGLVSKVVKDQDQLNQEIFKLAETIAEKSPVAVWTIKQVLNHDQNQRFTKNLEYMARVNASMLFTDDMQEAVRASMSKTKATFPKL